MRHRPVLALAAVLARSASGFYGPVRWPVVLPWAPCAADRRLADWPSRAIRSPWSDSDPRALSCPQPPRNSADPCFKVH